MKLRLNKKENGGKLVPLASSTAGTNDYIPICSMWDQVKRSTLYLNQIWKMFLEAMFVPHTTTLWIQLCIIITNTTFFILNTFCPKTHSLTAWIYGAAKCFGISVICPWISVAKMLMKFWLKYWNLSPFPHSLMHHDTAICVNFVDILCGLISLDKWLDRNWQTPLIYLDYS